jgi:hypothetical protein
MADLESALLDTALGFARGRLNELLTVLATDAKSLLEAVLGTVPGAQQLIQLQAVEGDVDSHLSAARAHLTALTADLAGPPATVGAVSGPFTEAAGAVTQVHDAIRSSPPWSLRWDRPTMPWWLPYVGRRRRSAGPSPGIVHRGG